MRGFPIHAITPILGKEAGLFAHHLDRLLPKVNGTQYEFESSEEFAKHRPPKMNQVYWTEILFRSHWAAAGAMVRTQRWLFGIHQSYTQHNLLATAACARGLIDATADAEFTLAVVPLTLAKDHQTVTTALKGSLPNPFINPMLEERLIHFTHARKPNKDEPVPKTQIALQVGEYRARLDKVEPKVSEFYRWLCDLTHPGASSVLSYAEALTPDAGRVRFALEAELINIERLRASLETITPDALMLGLNPALITLKLLNMFPVSRLHTPAMDEVDLNEIPMWQKVRGFLGKSA